MVFIQFVVCSAVILYAGVKLSHYGDVIAEKTGMGGTWVGVVLLASVTSLPELITGISSVSFAGVPDIAFGDVLGSCMFNILILALLDLNGGSMPLSTKAHQGHILTAGLGIFSIGGILFSFDIGPRMPALGWVGWNSIILLAVYLGAMKLVFSYERRRVAEFVSAEEESHMEISTKRAFAMYAMYSAFIVAAAAYLPYVGEEMARITGLGQTFVGSIFIAITTSLPEVVVSWSAMRIGAVDMAVGNLFGSNLFNIAILGIDDIFYTPGVLILDVTSTHRTAALGAMMMTAIAVIGLTYRASRKMFFLAWDSWAIIGVYALATTLLYLGILP